MSRREATGTARAEAFPPAPMLTAAQHTVGWIAWIAAGAVAAYTLYHYREALFMFYFFDDFWVMRDAAAIRIVSPADLLRFFAAGHAGFALYRPLSTVAYSYMLQSLVGFDASAQHTVQLLIFTGNVLLAFAITQRMIGSVVASTAAALLYAIAPGQAINAYWLSAFTVTGTAFWLLLMMACWLYAPPAWRSAACALLQGIALLSAEHGVEGPLLLAVLAVMRREPPRPALRAIAPSAAVVAVYLAAKFYYLVIWRPPAAISTLGTYSLTFDVTIWLEHIGQYVVQCFTPLALWQPMPPAIPSVSRDAVALMLSSGLLIVFALASWRAYRSGGPWTFVAGGIAVFLVGLAAVFPQRSRFGCVYICVAVLGMAWMVVGLCRLASRRGDWVALVFALALVALDGASGEQAWRGSWVWKLIINGSLGSARWMDTVRQAAQAGNDNVAVRSDAQTKSIFQMGEVQTFFPGMPSQVSLVDPQRPQLKPGQVYLRTPVPLTAPGAFPGAERRWDWLRRLAGPDSGEIRLGPNHEYPVQIAPTF